VAQAAEFLLCKPSVQTPVPPKNNTTTASKSLGGKKKKFNFGRAKNEKNTIKKA
jgi:hypothetical protein